MRKISALAIVLAVAFLMQQGISFAATGQTAKAAKCNFKPANKHTATTSAPAATK